MKYFRTYHLTYLSIVSQTNLIMASFDTLKGFVHCEFLADRQLVQSPTLLSPKTDFLRVYPSKKSNPQPISQIMKTHGYPKTKIVPWVDNKRVLISLSQMHSNHEIIISNSPQSIRTNQESLGCYSNLNLTFWLTFLPPTQSIPPRTD